MLREHASRSRIVNITINRRRYWNKYQQLRLTQNMRVSDGNIEWCDFLLAVGEGRLSEDDNNMIMLPDGVVQVKYRPCVHVLCVQLWCVRENVPFNLHDYYYQGYLVSSYHKVFNSDYYRGLWVSEYDHAVSR